MAGDSQKLAPLWMDLAAHHHVKGDDRISVSVVDCRCGPEGHRLYRAALKNVVRLAAAMPASSAKDYQGSLPLCENMAH